MADVVADGWGHARGGQKEGEAGNGDKRRGGRGGGEPTVERCEAVARGDEAAASAEDHAADGVAGGGDAHRRQGGDTAVGDRRVGVDGERPGGRGRGREDRRDAPPQNDERQARRGARDRDVGLRGAGGRPEVEDQRVAGPGCQRDVDVGIAVGNGRDHGCAADDVQPATVVAEPERGRLRSGAERGEVERQAARGRGRGRGRGIGDREADVVDAAAAGIAVARLRGGILNPQVLTRVLRRGAVGDDRAIRFELAGRDQMDAEEGGAVGVPISIRDPVALCSCINRPADDAALQGRHHFVADVCVTVGAGRHAGEHVSRERVGLARLHLAEVLGDGAVAGEARDGATIGDQSHVAVAVQARFVDSIVVAPVALRVGRSGVPRGTGVHAVEPARRVPDIGVRLAAVERIAGAVEDLLEAAID